MDETEIFRKFLVSIEAYKDLEELEKGVLEALQTQFEGDFEVEDQEYFWIRFEFPNLKHLASYDDFEADLERIFRRFLSNQPSAWQPNDVVLNYWEGKGSWIDFWMGPADLLSIIH